MSPKTQNMIPGNAIGVRQIKQIPMLVWRPRCQSSSVEEHQETECHIRFVGGGFKTLQGCGCGQAPGLCDRLDPLQKSVCTRRQAKHTKLSHPMLALSRCYQAHNRTQGLQLEAQQSIADTGLLSPRRFAKISLGKGHGRMLCGCTSWGAVVRRNLDRFRIAPRPV